MRHDSDHISDEDLLRASDGELSVQRAEQVLAHVAHCSACRAKMESLEAASADFSRAYRAAEIPDLPSAATARGNLQRRLASLSRAASPSRPKARANPLSSQGWAYAFAAALLLAALTLGWLRRSALPPQAHDLAASVANGPLLPDTRLTPGATRPVTANQICIGSGPAEARPPLRMQQAVFHEYGMDGAPPRNYEVDHLITPALGGTDDIRNLWPEPYASTEWNAHVKDDLEDHLHDLVCGGKLDLATAQRDMASNWIQAYKKYFHADQPLPHASELIDTRRRSPKG
ncbi:MAG TPA: zf-HC2 domain-containing protein [Candidatus Baltobacteraceae bacterium]|nr:zf-HC2 domain-containing protein [Candidatus Baltobacteraceae bacterium]